MKLSSFLPRLLALSLFFGLVPLAWAEPQAVTPVLYPVESSNLIEVGTIGRVEHVATLSNGFRSVVVSFPVSVTASHACLTNPGQSEEMDRYKNLVRLVPRFQWDPIRANQGLCAGGEGQKHSLRFSRTLTAFPPGSGQGQVVDRFILGAGAEASQLFRIRLITKDGEINGSTSVLVERI